MLGTALYFPHIDIDDPVWLRSAILFWDEIQTIVPSAIEDPYQNQDTRICQAEGYLKPLRCDYHSGIIDDLGRKIVKTLDHDDRRWRDHGRSQNSAFQFIEVIDEVRWQLEDSFEEVGLHPGKMSREMQQLVFQYGISQIHRGKVPPHIRNLLREIEYSQVHPDKMHYIIRDLFERSQGISPENGEWLLVDSRFAYAYMSALAAQLSQKLEISPLTSLERAQSMSFRFLFDDVVDSSKESAKGAMIAVVMRGLKVDASVPVKKLINFREARRDQYADLSGKLLELSNKITNASEGAGPDLITKATECYTKDIEPSLRALRRELNQQSISTIWEGAYRAITISVPSAGALAYFTGLTGPALLGAGAALAAADIGVRGYLAGRKARASNPFSYLHDISNNFGLPDFGDA